MPGDTAGFAPNTCRRRAWSCRPSVWGHLLLLPPAWNVIPDSLRSPSLAYTVVYRLPTRCHGLAAAIAAFPATTTCLPLGKDAATHLWATDLPLTWVYLPGTTRTPPAPAYYLWDLLPPGFILLRLA